jgi:hypothetical protein
MREEVGEEIVRTLYDITCDFCNIKTKGISSVLLPKWHCKICKRDTCHKCMRYDYRYSDDYPDKYCPECWEVGKHYLKLLEIEQYRHDDKVDDLEKRWFEKAKFEATQKMK